MRRALLTLDAAVSLALGTILIVAPFRLGELLELPPFGKVMWPTLVGALLFGIGVALGLEAVRPGVGGLGLAGAIFINVLTGGAVVSWLIASGPTTTPTARTALWSVAAAVFLLAFSELVGLVVGGVRSRAFGVDRPHEQPASPAAVEGREDD